MKKLIAAILLAVTIITAAPQAAVTAEASVKTEMTGAVANAASTTKDKTYKIQLPNGKTTTIKGHYESKMESEIVSLLNTYRKSKNRGTLKTKTALINCADVRARECSHTFSHTRPNNKKWYTANDATYGENIAMGYKTAKTVMNAWKKSASHNANMLKAGYKTVGVSVFARQLTTKSGKTYYVYYSAQEFGY